MSLALDWAKVLLSDVVKESLQRNENKRRVRKDQYVIAYTLNLTVNYEKRIKDMDTGIFTVMVLYD